MLLSDLYTNLSYGVFSNLSIGSDGAGTIPTESQDRLLHYVQRGLTALHTKFYMVSKELVVQAFDGKTLYPLQQKYALTDPTVVPKKYIADSIEHPFLGDLIKIVAVADEGGLELPLNDTNDIYSLFTPSPDILQIPMAVTGDAYFLLYQADHPKLAPGDLTQEVNIPGMLEEPLELYVASKVLSSMNGPEHAAKSVEYFERYELIADNILKQDLLSTSQVETTSKFSERGFK